MLRIHLDPLVNFFFFFLQRVKFECAAECVLGVGLLLGLSLDQLKPFHLLLEYGRENLKKKHKTKKNIKFRLAR